MHLVAISTKVSNRVVHDLLAAFRTAVIYHFVVDSHVLYERADFVELWLLLCTAIVAIVIKSNFIYNFLD